jgi:hypothetical protein
MKSGRLSLASLFHPGITLFIVCLIVFSVANCTKPEPAQKPPASETPQQPAAAAPQQPTSKSEVPETPPAAAPQVLSKLEIKPLESPLHVGDSQSLVISAFDANQHEQSDLSVTWTAENPTIVSVNAQGQVTALAPGTATVTASSQGISASVQIEVQGLTASKVEILPSKVSLSVGDTQQLDALVTDLKNQEIKGLPVVWKSKNPAIAKVDKNGLVKAESSGLATIVAKVKNKTVSVQVTVSKRIPPRQKVRQETASGAIGHDKPKTADAAPKVEKPAAQAAPAEPAKPVVPIVPPDTVKPADAPKVANFPNINVAVLDYSWKPGTVWENLNKTECLWTAKIKNNNPESRHICINYEFLDEDNLTIFQTGKCEVILANSEGTIASSIIVQSRLIQDVKKSNVVALEAHRLHTFAPAPPSQ